jgi:hypothetical protein
VNPHSPQVYVFAVSLQCPHLMTLLLPQLGHLNSMYSLVTVLLHVPHFFILLTNKVFKKL